MFGPFTDFLSIMDRKQIFLPSDLSTEVVEQLLFEDIPSGPESECDFSDDESIEVREEICNVEDSAHTQIVEIEEPVNTNDVDSVLHNNITWNRKYVNFNCIPFEQETGPILTVNIESPIDVFYCIFPKNLIDKIVFETNLYSLQKHDGRNPLPTTVGDIKKFIAINLLMGIKNSQVTEITGHLIESTEMNLFLIYAM